MTVRFTYRRNKIRIFGTGYWRKGKKIYERKIKSLAAKIENKYLVDK